MKVGLTIAGTDPSGGAGINVDLQVFRDFGYHGVAAISAVVWQNTRGVQGYRELEPMELRRQLEALTADVKFDCVKVGMVPTGDLMLEVRRFLEGVDPEIPVVLDPVMASGSGDRALMAPTGMRVLESLRGRVDLITPNANEAALMLGKLRWEGKAEDALRGLLARGWKRVLLKGGHLPSGPAGEEKLVDWYGEAKGEITALEGLDRIRGEVRGTGCQLSTAIAATRGNGEEWRNAVERGRVYLHEMIREKRRAIGGGASVVVRV